MKMTDFERFRRLDGSIDLAEAWADSLPPGYNVVGKGLAFFATIEAARSVVSRQVAAMALATATALCFPELLG